MKELLTLTISLFILLIGCNSPEGNEKDLTSEPPVMCAPLTTDASWYLSDNKAPIFEGLDVLHFPITTDVELAQKYFNQGLALSYGFNHAEAARSFHYATKLDTTCAMAQWGFAYVLGPNYNAGMESDNYERAYTAIQKALALSSNCTPKEKALIDALSKRYVKEPVEDRSALDIAYSDAMKQVFQDFPNDADIGALYAESIMDLHPWDLWEKDGTPKEWTPGILQSLENVLAIDPQHIGAHHFYIHAIEASKTPEKGLRSAALLDSGIVPGSGHLVHMPSHIYIRTGDYHKGTVANINAVKVDSNYVTACHAQGAYPLAYYPHNYHFLAATATLEGNGTWAIKAANKVSEHAHKEVMKEPGWGTLQHFYTIPYYVYLKFGKWDDVLAMTNFDSTLKYPEAVRHYARGMAYLGKGNIENAKSELAALEPYADDEELQEITIWDLNTVHTLMQIARRVLKAEILASEKQFDESITLLKEAVAIEDQLNYDEPPDWFFSVRHHLGAVQIEAGKYQNAVATFVEDLERLPKNGWALHGLKTAYEKLGDKDKVIQTEAQLEKAWATADVSLTNARLK